MTAVYTHTKGVRASHAWHVLFYKDNYDTISSSPAQSSPVHSVGTKQIDAEHGCGATVVGTRMLVCPSVPTPVQRRCRPPRACFVDWSAAVHTRVVLHAVDTPALRYIMVYSEYMPSGGWDNFLLTF